MNKFRANLHPAFFETPIESEWRTEVVSETLEFERELEELKQPILDEFKTSTDKFLSAVNGNQEKQILSRYTNENREQLRADSRRFNERINQKNWEKRYSEIWSQKISEWFWALITSLKDGGYFKGKNVRTETAKIKETYWNEVKNQYIENVWFAEDATFDAVKDSIFGVDSPDSPANKTYQQLTWAATISRVDRTFTEWYGSDILWDIVWDDVEGTEDPETFTDRQNRKFLSNELTKYLWDARKAPGILFDIAQGIIPILSVKIDRPSKEDRKAISKFLKTSTKINVAWGKDPAIALLELFRDNNLNTDSTPDNYKSILQSHGITLKKDKYINDIVEAGSFYISTQKTTDSVRDQHAIYLSVLKIIETEWWANNATNKFKDVVEQAKEDKKMERKQGYETGDTLNETEEGRKLKELSTKLWILDFTSVSRLNALDSKYFSDTSVEQILANLNNDRTIDARDSMAWWLKTGKQFLEIFNQIWKEKALSNLLEHAKLVNKTLNLGLDESKFTEAEIKAWNKEIILLLQDIISKPWEDLITLLTDRIEDPFEGVDLSAAQESADRVAKEKAELLEAKREAYEKQGLRLPTSESMQSWLAATLMTEYTRWIWLWNKISFDEWIDWLEMNTWFQIRDGKEVVVWIGLDYSKKINLWKWWSTSPELSAGAFIPLWYGKPEVTPSVWLNNEVAKEWVTNLWIKEHIWLSAGATLMPAGVVVVSVWLNWGQDKLAWIETRELEMKWQLNEKMKEILNNIYVKRSQLGTEGATKLDFNDPTLVDTVKEELWAVATELWVKDKDRDTVINATMRLLVNYSNWDLSQEAVRNLIAELVAEQYAMTWAEARKAKITENIHLSWLNLGVFWTVGSPLVWVYAGAKATKFSLDGYGDRWWEDYGLDHNYEWGRNEDLIKSFNQEAWFEEGKWLSMKDGYIVIPSSLAHRVNVNEKLRWNMKKENKDSEWNYNILLHNQTPMAAKIKRWAATQWSEIIIWWKKWENFSKLDRVWDDWFTTEDINQDAILEMGEGISEYNVDILNKALDELKKKLPWNPIWDFDFSALSTEALSDLLSKLNGLDKTKKANLTIKDMNGQLEMSDPTEWEPWRWLEIKYQSRIEMISDQVRDVVESVYAEADKVTCNVLTLMCHHLPWQKDTRRPDYIKFADAMKDGEYATAKSHIVKILKRLDIDINKQQKNNPVNFSAVADKIGAMADDDISLWQALMSVNNIFARSIKVTWKWQEEVDGKKISRYGLSLPMGTIIKEREGQIRGTVTDKVPEPWKSAYLALIDASQKYREQTQKEENGWIFNTKESKAAQLENTIWFNLWNSVNPENPLFNPEIFAQMIDLKDLENLGFGEEQRIALHEHTMRLYAENLALINPVLKALWLEGKSVEITWFEQIWEEWKLKLDIWWKKVTLSAWMKFGYFTQCVNHTIILHDIFAETEDGTTVRFNSGVWENGIYTEGNKNTRHSRFEVGVSVGVTLRKEKPEGEPEFNPRSHNGNDGLDEPGEPGTTPWQTGGQGGDFNSHNWNDGLTPWWSTGWGGLPSGWGGWLD